MKSKLLRLGNKGGTEKGIDEGLIISWFVGVDVGAD
jgi:hypothetical protein